MAKNYLAQNVNNAEFEKPGVREVQGTQGRYWKENESTASSIN